LPNERQLLRNVAEGDASSFKILFTHYWDQIYSTAFFFTKSIETSEDVAQEVFAAIWVKRAHLRDVMAFQPYLYVAARNHIFDRLRKKQFSGTEDDYLRLYFSNAEADPATRLEYKEFGTSVQEAINSLTAQQQTAFRLSRFDGLSHEEVALKMGLSKRTVKNHIVHALASLRKSMQRTARLVLLCL